MEVGVSIWTFSWLLSVNINFVLNLNQKKISCIILFFFILPFRWGFFKLSRSISTTSFFSFPVLLRLFLVQNWFSKLIPVSKISETCQQLVSWRHMFQMVWRAKVDTMKCEYFRKDKKAQNKSHRPKNLLWFGRRSILSCWPWRNGTLSNS